MITASSLLPLVAASGTQRTWSGGPGIWRLTTLGPLCLARCDENDERDPAGRGDPGGVTGPDTTQSPSREKREGSLSLK